MDSGDLPLLVAADGMPVRPLRTPANALMGAAIGYLAPGSTFAVHYHPSLEQLAICMEGRVTVLMQVQGAPHPVECELRPGEVITTPPMATLSFSNPFNEAAELMFVCTPPFPSDSEGAIVVSEHGPLTARPSA